MIAIRKTNGKLEPVEDGQFVELTDADGNLGVIIFASPAGGVHLIEPGDKGFADYRRMFGVKKVVNQRTIPIKPR